MVSDDKANTSNEESTITNEPSKRRAETSVPVWQRRYKFVRDLNKGGMNKVTLVERCSDSPPVCVKFLNSGADPRTLEQECRALMRLRHPAIVSLLDFSFEDEPSWLATEYILGSTLRTYLEEKGPLSLGTLLEILKPLLDGLAYAHDQGVIHRDLKPANLVIDVTGDPKLRILDFVLAIVDRYDHEGRETAANAPLYGTLMYMAPEQLEGKLLSSACDLYAVGLVTWEALMGRSFFGGKTLAQTIHEKLGAAEGIALEDTSGSVPAKLRSFVQACTRADPCTRPTALEGIAMLRSLEKA
jgi:eukaryotic-like serine/threonine-protein kinase